MKHGAEVTRQRDNFDVRQFLGKGISPRQATLLALRITLGCIFLYAGVIKVSHPGDFVSDLRGFRLFPEFAVLSLASYLPFLEMLVGVALILGLLYRGAILLSGSLLAGFGIAIVSAIARKLDITCGCFGHHGANPSLWGSLTRDGVLFLIWGTLAGLLMMRKGNTPPA